MSSSGLTASDISSLIAATGGLVAAIAAGISAYVAKQSADRAASIDRRSQMREAVTLANSIVADTIRVDDLANKLKRLYRDGAMLAGQSGGSRSKLAIGEVEKKQASIGPIQESTREVVENWRALESKGDSEFTELLAELDGNFVQVKRVKEKFLHDIDTAQADNENIRNQK